MRKQRPENILTISIYSYSWCVSKIQTFQYTHFSSCHPFSVKKGFYQRRGLAFTENKLEFLTRLLERGYRRELTKKILAEVNFSSRSEALLNKITTSNNVLPLVTTFNPATPNLEKSPLKHWHLITENNKLAETFPKPPIVAYRKDKSLKDILDSAKIPPHI